MNLLQKLRIQPGYHLLSLNAPEYFASHREFKGLHISDKEKNFDQVHWFVKDRATLEKQMSKVMKLLKPGIIVWVYYPKISSGIKTDLTRDKGWDCLLKEDNKLKWINLISFDETWSVFGFRGKTDEDKKKDAKPKPEREIFKWVDPKTKTIALPEDLAAYLKKNQKEFEYFNSLSFTNRKEYLEWIVTAKREETRKERIVGTIERLKKGWKNPRNM